MIDKHIEQILNNAFVKANKERFEFFTTEHMLLALCTNDMTTREALVELGADVTEMTENIKSFLTTNSPKLRNTQESTVPTSIFHRIIERTNVQRRSAARDSAGGIHILISIMDESESHAVYYIKKQGIKKLDLMHFASRTEVEGDQKVNEKSSTQDYDKENNPLQKYCTNLNKLAENGKIDPLIGRDNEITRTVQILSRRRKNNPILVGEAGVGKTAIAEGLAKKIVDNEVPPILTDAIIYSVDLGAIVAGSKYRGDFEKRIKSLVKTLIKMDNVIIFIDEIHALLGAGSTSENTLDASNLLKPALSSGQLRCIGATTYKEYKNSFDKNAALARRFQKIDILEPSKEETVEIINGLLPHFEDFHGVKYATDTVRHSVDLADKFIHDRYLPDKAIDLIDEVGARAKIQSPPKKRVNNRDIETVLAKIANIPEQTLSAGDKKTIKQLENRLQRQVFGQDKAIMAVTSTIKMAKAGLKDLEKPIGAFLFTGPTGVGKTEVSRLFAKELGVAFLRFDLSEYMEAHTVSRLIGSPPGYVGYDQGGLLTNAIANTPHCVLLLDEIEKAHPDIFNLLLQVMDYGQLTDSNGKSVNFSNVVLIMTSNVGAAALEKNNIGFTEVNRDSIIDISPDLKQTFSPEFRNRLTEIIEFSALSKDIVLKIIDKLIYELNTQIKSQNITLKVNKNAKKWLLDKGYNPLMGARPMSRLINKTIKQPLSEQILFGDLKNGGEVIVKLDKSQTNLMLETVSKSLVKL